MNFFRPTDTRIVTLTQARLDEFVGVAENFFRESRVSEFARFDKEAFRKKFNYDAIEFGQDVVLLAIHQDRVVGFAIILNENWWTMEPVAHLRAIYVVPELRRGVIGRQLLAAAELVAKNDRACMLVAAPDAGMDSDKTLLNLFRKYGFEIGPGTAVKVLT